MTLNYCSLPSPGCQNLTSISGSFSAILCVLFLIDSSSVDAWCYPPLVCPDTCSNFFHPVILWYPGSQIWCHCWSGQVSLFFNTVIAHLSTPNWIPLIIIITTSTQIITISCCCVISGVVAVALAVVVNCYYHWLTTANVVVFNRCYYENPCHQPCLENTSPVLPFLLLLLLLSFYYAFCYYAFLLLLLLYLLLFLLPLLLLLLSIINTNNNK